LKTGLTNKNLKAKSKTKWEKSKV